MKYHIEYSDQTEKCFKKLDKSIAKTIYLWIDKNLKGCSNPRIKGKQVSANHSDKWRYRVGNYRLIVKIYDDRLLILTVCVGHRKDIYDTL
ncbi:MAG: type II toxin-antitoxin system RelE/ParE family toxin [Holosporales bacterium]|jgi:mRNA interferase RelE/StbE|nr:type II toxin-antitoxin system RelE/ParE family toxin [Holosporales bacterium]